MSPVRIFATIALIYGIVLMLLAFTWQLPWPNILHGELAMGIGFLVSVLFFLPFVITFTRLGLNTAEGEKPSPETNQRLATLSKECRMWPVTWYGMMGLIALAWLAFLVWGDAIHPMFAFSGAISLASGLWFAFVYPTAKRLFD
jgi:hypothetical protein